MLFWFLFRIFDNIIVHSSAEVEYLSKRYKVSAVKFSFIPYFWYEPAGKDEHREFRPMPLSPIFCSAGNNRDFDTFIRAINLTRDRGRIIGAKKGEILNESQIEVYPSVPCDEYNSLIADSDIVVISLYRNRFQQSLGQILLMKAFGLHIPCIVARNKYIMDYCNENTVVFYEPENVASLRQAIERIKTMPNQELETMTNCAYASLQKRTRDNYLKQIKRVLTTL